MNQTTFTPKNELEKQLLDAQVFLPVHDDTIAGIQTSDKARPITLQGESGNNILVIFTSLERTQDFIATNPGQSGGLLESFRRIIERAGSGVSVSLNPGWDYGLDLEPEMVAELMSKN